MSKTPFAALVACCILLAVLATPQALAALDMPHIFTDHMVLQRDAAVPIWGMTEAGAAVTVAFAGQSVNTVTGADGKWQVTLKPMPASSEGRALTVTSADRTRTIEDVLVGDVWICSGQSNMQFGVRSALNHEEEINTANFPQIRLLTVPNVTSIVPLDDIKSNWKVCTPDTVAGFTAVGYFFGRDLHQALGIPIGLIHSSWGGTIAEAWTSEEALRANLPEFNDKIDQVKANAERLAEAKAKYAKSAAVFNGAKGKVYDLEEDATARAARAGADFDDAAWKTMELPGNWEIRGLDKLDGIVWFRKTVEIPAAWAGKDLTLRTGPIDEVDVTFFNGVEVGARGNSRKNDVQYWNSPREYPVPGKLVQAGRATIAIRVTDLAGQGGLWGGAAVSMNLQPADGSAANAAIPLAGEWRYEVEFAIPDRPSNPDSPNHPTILFNAMINPLIPFAIRGATWYQGESNASRPEQYRTLLPTMIADWRARFGVGDFPFLVVQLANFMAVVDQPAESNWAELREAQAMTAQNDPKVGLALAIDVGDTKDIHPKDKQTVGARLALAARGIAYGEDIPYSGPVFESMTVADGKATLSFTHTNGGLVAKGGGPLTGFAVAGADKRFVWATAEIVGETVVVSAEGVAEPAFVRYAWGNNPVCNLYNGADLPAVPFRSDMPAAPAAPVIK